MHADFTSHDRARATRCSAVVATWLLTMLVAMPAAAAVDPEDNVALRVALQLDAAVYSATRYHKPPQCAIWIEDPAGEVIRTIYVTQLLGRGTWQGKSTCPVALPYWVRRYNQETGTSGDPTADRPVADAISQPTPVNQLEAVTHVARGTTWKCFVEVNASGDYNDAFPAELSDHRRDESGNGQPSIVYCADIRADPGERGEWHLIGRTDQLQPSAELRHDLSGITTARDLLVALEATISAPEKPAAGAIRLIVRGDDIGSSQAANEACIRCYREGVVRSVEVMVPAPWFFGAAKLLRDNPQLDVGVHLTLTSEWENVKWGPLTQAPTLVDAQGHFFPMTSQQADFPPHTGFLEANPDLGEVERELRAQIETARRELPNVTHLSSHMGTPTCTPALRQLTARLAEEYQLPLRLPELKMAGDFGGSNVSAEEKLERLVQLLEELEPGTWLIVEHPGLDTPEMRAIGHHGYENVAEDRVGVTAAFTSERVKEVIARRNIELISYGDLIRQQARP